MKTESRSGEYLAPEVEVAWVNGFEVICISPHDPFFDPDNMEEPW